MTSKAATAHNSSQRVYFLASLLGSSGLLSSMLLLAGNITGQGNRRRRIRKLLLPLTLVFLVTTIGCGGGQGGAGVKSPPPDAGTPTGAYQVVVNATSGSTVSVTSFTLVVQ